MAIDSPIAEHVPRKGDEMSLCGTSHTEIAEFWPFSGRFRRIRLDAGE